MAGRYVDEPTPDRDRVIDLIRAFSLSVVVLGHLVMGMVKWDVRGPILGNVLASSPYLQLLTWLLQVMPLFFIAGGAAGAISWRKARDRAVPYRLWLFKRLQRLLAPALVYLVVMIAVGFGVQRITDEATARTQLALTTQLLWFLGVYLLVTALTPLVLKWHERFGWYSVAGYLLLAALIDVARLTGTAVALGLLNFVVVWSMAAQLGMLYLDRERNPRHAWQRLAIPWAP